MMVCVNRVARKVMVSDQIGLSGAISNENEEADWTGLGWVARLGAVASADACFCFRAAQVEVARKVRRENIS